MGCGYNMNVRPETRAQVPALPVITALEKVSLTPLSLSFLSSKMGGYVP